MNIDEKYMDIALTLAKRAEGLTNPNPAVGALVVKNNRIVGRGYHRKCGLPHAEINALARAGRNARGATLYVTLEPCDHYGRTPPCTDAIIKSGIKKVIMAMRDPNPINNGKGVAALRRAGVNIESGVLREDAISLNAPYIKFITQNIPYVTVKIAQSLDGKIATRTGDSRWITSEDARSFVHKLRGRVDGVMVGVNTVIRDDPSLLSNASARKQPVRIIVDSALRSPRDAKIFSTVSTSPIVIAATRSASSDKIRMFESIGAKVLLTKSKSGRVDLNDLMRSLGRMKIMHLLVEGGGELVASLSEAKLIDRFLFFIAPKIIGGVDAVTSVEGKGAKTIAEALALKNIKIKLFDKDLLIESEAG